MSSWIFQGNPDKFDVDEYLRKTDYVYWSVTWPAHQKQMAIGDKVFIWRAKGKMKAVSGLVAFGSIAEECTGRDKVKKPMKIYDSLWNLGPQEEASEIKVGVQITEVRLSPGKGMVTLDEILCDPVLSDMQIVKARQGSNFSLTEAQYQRLVELWGSVSDEQIEFQPTGLSVLEGKIYYRIHRTRERDSNIVKKAKAEFLKKHGCYFCEICKLKLEEKYGDLASGFIEAHHIKPVNKMKLGDKTSVDDLMMLCPNCHRILHRGDPEVNLEKMKNLFKD